MTRFIRLFLLVASLAFGISPAHAQSFPPLSGRVVDAANIIPDNQEPAMVAKLAALEAITKRQLVVATVPDLQGYPIEDYGYRLGRAWGIGEKDRNTGLILIVAPNERRVRVEVGYGLEPVVTDALSGRIIRDQITPRFKAGDMPGGINAGMDALIKQMQLPPDEAAKVLAQAQQQSRHQNSGIPLSTIIFWLIILFFVVLPIIRSSVRGGRRYGSGVGPVVIWGGNDWGGGSGGSSWGGGGFGGGGGFSGGGGSFGGGGASGGW